MEDEILLTPSSTPLPADVDERSREIQNAEDVSHLVYDVVSKVCVVCDYVLNTPWRSPLCYNCHATMYPGCIISEETFNGRNGTVHF